MRLRILMVALLMVAASEIGRAQEVPAPFGSFFLQVSALAGVTGPVFLNGEPSEIIQPHPQAVLGLSDAEWRVLRGIADEFRVRSDAFERQVRSFTFDRWMAMAAGEDSPDLRQQINDVERRRASALAEAVGRLQREMGPRFTAVNGFVRERKGAESFFPTIKPLAK